MQAGIAAGGARVEGKGAEGVVWDTFFYFSLLLDFFGFLLPLIPFDYGQGYMLKSRNWLTLPSFIFFFVAFFFFRKYWIRAWADLTTEPPDQYRSHHHYAKRLNGRRARWSGRNVTNSLSPGKGGLFFLSFFC